MRKIFFTLLSLFIISIAKGEITTPYPEAIEIKQINSAEKERIRLCQGHKKYDKQPTGFYVEAGKKVVVNVEILTPAAQNVMPVLTVGTMGFNVSGRNTGTHFTLAAGVNTITNHSGGLIWLSFIQDGSADPKGLARITFTSESEQVRAPHFVYGVTSTVEFYEMMNTYTTPDVLYHSDYIAVVSTREAAEEYTKTSDKNKWMESIHTLLAKEDEIGGMDNDDTNSVHHRLRAGEVRFLLVENTSTSPHANSGGYTGYPSASRNRYLTVLGTSSNGSWMLGHELGHQHQQPAYMINLAGESTVNIYSYVVERNIQGSNYNRTTAARWTGAQKTYLKLPFSKRVYDMDSDLLQSITGFNRDELRFMVWEQFFLIFGDQFYQTLHRVVREEKIIGGDADERRAYLIWKASQVSGYDLTEFLNLWGIRVTDSVIKANLRAKMANAKSKGEILDLRDIGHTAEDLLMVTGQARPAWTPIPLRGITSSAPATPETLDRSGWTIVTSHAGPSDSAVGGDKPEYIIDDDGRTAFAFVKPGKSYGGITVAEDAVPSFTIDMKEVKTFNCVIYAHRSYNNNYDWLRARQISVYGSNNGSDFTPLAEHHVIDHVKNADEIIVEFSTASYRYIRVEIEDWNKENGSTVQVADFKVGTKAPEEVLPVPPPLKFKVEVKADEGIITSQAGLYMADEDSDYTLDFTLVQGKKATVTLDGDTITPTENDGAYSLTVKVTNHLDINIVSSNKNTALETPSKNRPLSLYPNPVKAGQPFHIRLDNEPDGTVISVYTLAGAKLSECKAEAGQAELTVEKQGIYIIEVKGKDGVSTLKAVVN
jgi:hypothetical protein